MSALRNQGFAWTQRRTVDGGGHTITMLRISCRSCTSFVEKARTQMNQAPVPLEKWFKRQGWSLDYRKPGSVICPKCQEKPSKDNVVQMHAAPATPQPMKEIAVSTPTPYVAPEVRKAPEGAVPRQLTDAERDKVRDLLERFFGGGVYHAGYSDQRIAEEASVPRVRVAEMREIAFGKIKADPELQGLLADISALRHQMQLQVTTLASMETKLNGLSERVQAALKRVMP